MSDYIVEPKVITYLSEKEVGEDIHIVKEVEYRNGKYIDNLKIIKDYKRPFHITKPMYRNHKDKKESEKISRVQTYHATESKLYDEVNKRLGDGYVGKPDVRKIKRSPYLYGCDVDSRTYLKNDYLTKNNNTLSPYRIGVFDIEVNVLTTEIIILSIATGKKMITGLLKSFADTIPNINKKLRELYNKYIPNTKFKKIDVEYIVFDTEIDMIKHIFQQANYMEIDILTAWNIKYDITFILDVLEINQVDPADVFHYDLIPEKYKFFKFTEGQTVKRTEAGREIAVSIEERWHVIKATTNYQFLDAMASHRYVRAGGATVSGGYSLDNILAVEGVDQKLKFDFDTGHQSIEWHIYMVANHPAEYVIYNNQDDLSVLNLDDKTKDLSVSVPLLLGVSHPDIFNSGPRRIVDALTFFYAKKGLVLGVKDPSSKNDKILGLGKWIITLDTFLSMDNGMNILKESDRIKTLIKSHVMDLDQSSGYPSNTMAANVSKDTTHRELISISGIPKNIFMMQNINLMFGRTNAVEYCQYMFNLPSIYDVIKNTKEKDTI